MSSKDKIYHSYLPRASRFEVTDLIKNNIYPPGSNGYFVYTMPHNMAAGSGIVKAVVVFLRRGKSGKDRIETKQVSLPGYYEEKREGKIEQAVGDYNKRGCLELTELVHGNKDTMALSPLDFVGWAAAKTMFMHYIRHNYVTLDKMWPKSKEHVLNVFRNTQNIDYLLSKKKDLFEHTYANPDIRIGVINALRTKEVQMFRAVEQYEAQIKANKRLCLQGILKGLGPRTVIHRRLTELHNSII